MRASIDGTPCRFLADCMRSEPHTNCRRRTVQTIKQTIVNATTHREITTRRWAVRVLGQIGTLDDVALLQRIAETDGDTGPRFSVREEAVKAIETIRQRK